MAVHRAAPPVHDRVCRSVPPQGIKLTPLPLRVPEDFPKAATTLHLLHHPELRGISSRARLPMCFREAERLLPPA